MNRFIEIDTWEAQHARAAEGVETVEQKSAWEVAAGSVPLWTWMLVGVNLAVVAESAATRLLLPADSMARTYWGVTQLLLGLVTLLVLHVTCFVMASAEDADLGIADLIVKPARAWMRMLADLPERLWLATAGSTSATGAIAAALIVGGIPWYVLLDWKFKQPPKQNLMGAVMAQAQQIEGEEKPLDEAVQDFAGGEGAAGSKTDTKPEPPKPQMQADCLVIGFTPAGDDGIATLLLASDHLGKLTYAGTVVPKLGEKESRELREKLQANTVAQPFINTSRTATWVKPLVTCRVGYETRTATGGMTKLQWDSLLGEIQLPW